MGGAGWWYSSASVNCLGGQHGRAWPSLRAPKCILRPIFFSFFPPIPSAMTLDSPYQAGLSAPRQRHPRDTDIRLRLLTGF